MGGSLFKKKKNIGASRRSPFKQNQNKPGEPGDRPSPPRCEALRLWNLARHLAPAGRPAEDFIFLFYLK